MKNRSLTQIQIRSRPHYFYLFACFNQRSKHINVDGFPMLDYLSESLFLQRYFYPISSAS